MTTVKDSSSTANDRPDVFPALDQAISEDEVLDALMSVGSHDLATMLSVALWIDVENQVAEVVRCETYQSGLPPFPVGSRFSTTDFPMMAKLMADQPFISGDLSNDMEMGEQDRQFAKAMGQNSAVIAPMSKGQEWIGGLMIISPELNYFDAPKVALYEQMAQAASTALGRVRS